jgi:arylsulfatase A
MKILKTITGSGLLLFSLFFSCNPSNLNEKKPNIILIMTDDMGYETVGAYGGESYQTPQLDKLAQSGMRFEHAHSTPVCTPTRVQIMSGRYNSRNYIGFGAMDSDIYTFGNLFQENGYTTFIGGKWQLGGDLSAPNHFGFDEYCLWQVTRQGRGPNPVANRYPNPGLAINGKKVDYNEGEYGPDIVNNHVLEFIERHQTESFFVYYPMILPHFPFEPTPDSKDWDPEARRFDKMEQPGKGDEKYFGDMVEYVDKMVGKVITKLDELKLRENTLIIFTGDNGTEKGVKSILDGKIIEGGKLTSTDAGTHVPLIVNWPGVIPANSVNEDLICFTYFFPTLAEIAGIEIPDELQLDGQSFAPQLRGDGSSLRDWLYMWWYRNNDPGGTGPGNEFARTHRYKLYSDNRFYDLQLDPLEQKPIVYENFSVEQKEIAGRLSDIIKTYTRQ